MEYYQLSGTYRDQQLKRIVESLKRLSERDTAGGRVVPDTDDLALGAGRSIDMAVLFLDISGFSGWPSENQSEQLTNLRALTLFFTEMVRVAEDYGGTVEKNTGDGLMAYFEDGGGDPSAPGAGRAVACALTMMSTVEALINPVLRAVSLEPIRFRVSVDYGLVTVAKLGAPRRFSAIVAVGTAANIASKMLAFATEGEILIGEAVRKQLLPIWQLQWTQRIEEPSGWVYRQSGEVYPFYRYTGRWIEPKGST